jgi:hypothetical protein
VGSSDADEFVPFKISFAFYQELRLTICGFSAMDVRYVEIQ